MTGSSTLLSITDVSVEKVVRRKLFFFRAALDLFLVGSALCAYTVAISFIGLLLRNRTSRFRFCAVAAK